ncbi:hypothetical protein C8J56DRAFT_1115200 [Mycena floridula]|nr:hypothetical protein C8J56DRAFT_1115200 [Mycena floridula]
MALFNLMDHIVPIVIVYSICCPGFKAAKPLSKRQDSLVLLAAQYLINRPSRTRTGHQTKSMFTSQTIPSPSEAFWGTHYERLLSIKKEIMHLNLTSLDSDSNGLLDCWPCVGWKGAEQKRYKCYI